MLVIPMVSTIARIMKLVRVESVSDPQGFTF